MSIKKHSYIFYTSALSDLPRSKLNDTDSNFLVFRILDAVGHSGNYSKSAHYKRAFIESFYDRELKLALRSGNKVVIKKVNKIWSYLLSHDLITAHPCRRSTTYGLTTEGYKLLVTIRRVMDLEN